MLDDLGAALGGGALEGGVVHGLALGAGLVGDRAHDGEGHAVGLGRLSDCGALHLAAQGPELLHDARAGGLVAHELVARRNAAGEHVDLGRRRGSRGERRLAQARVSDELHLLASRDEAGLVAELLHREVVLDAVRGDDEVADVEAGGVERPGDARVDEVRAAEVVGQGLGADAGVHLADAALDHDHVLLAQAPAVVVLPGHALCVRVRKLGLEVLDLDVHGPDDPDLHVLPFRA